jgi:hypothetical protein
MRLTVFTCVVGQTDPLRRPRLVNRSVRYICFSDVPQCVPPYECILVPKVENHKLQSREIKISANHPALVDCDATLWHDAAFRLDCDPLRVARTLLNATNMVALRHPHRNTIEEEAAAIAKWGWIPMATMQAQIAAYRADGFKQTQITSTGLCFRRTTPALAAFNAFWWAQVQQWGWRDQMSVDYALWKTGVRPHYIPGHYRDNTYAKWFQADANGRSFTRQRQYPERPRRMLPPRSIGYRTVRRS